MLPYPVALLGCLALRTDGHLSCCFTDNYHTLASRCRRVLLQGAIAPRDVPRSDAITPWRGSFKVRVRRALCSVESLQFSRYFAWLGWAGLWLLWSTYRWWHPVMDDTFEDAY